MHRHVGAQQVVDRHRQLAHVVETGVGQHPRLAVGRFLGQAVERAEHLLRAVAAAFGLQRVDPRLDHRRIGGVAAIGDVVLVGDQVIFKRQGAGGELVHLLIDRRLDVVDLLGHAAGVVDDEGDARRDVAPHPVVVVGQARVDAGRVGRGTALAPTDDAGLLPARGRAVEDHQRPAAVALARVDAARVLSGAEHVGRDRFPVDVVVFLATDVGDDGHDDLLQGVDRRAAEAERAPAGHGGVLSDQRAHVGGHQPDPRDGQRAAVGRPVVDRGGQSQQGDVVVEGRAFVVIGMD